MATKPIQEAPRYKATGNDELRGRSLVAHVEAKIALASAASSHGKPASSND